SRKCTTAPSGSADGGSAPVPLPIARSPQVSDSITLPDPSRVAPQEPVPATLANSTVSGSSGGRSVLVVVLVVVGVVVVGAPLVVVVLLAVVDVVVVVGPLTCLSRTIAGRLAAPGPGRFAAALTTALFVDGMQNTDASVTGTGASGLMGPAGSPSARPPPAGQF